MYKQNPIRVLVADDHDVYRDGLRMLLKRQPDVEWVGEAANGHEVMQQVEKLKPEVILMDIMMPVMDGITVTRLLREQAPAVSVIALSMFNEDHLIVDMLEAGAKGYLLKNTGKKEIAEAIISVYKQIPYYCKSTSTKLAKLIAKSRFNQFESLGQPHFSEREIQIIQMICLEMTTKEIGEKLFLSSRTVEGYRQKILEKIEVKSVMGLVVYAIKNGLFTPQ